MTIQWHLLARVLDDVPAEAYNRPTRLGDWSVRELVAHLAATIRAVHRAVAGAGPGRPDTTLSVYLSGTGAVADATRDRAHAMARTRDAARVREVFDTELSSARRAVRDLGEAADTAVVTVRQGRLLLVDYLVSRLVETVVHLGDLHAALPEVAYPPQLLTGNPDRRRGGVADVDADAAQVVTRALADLLAFQLPGQTCEVRITDPRLGVGAAVQCLEGPRHTRGTPPNVVEVTDAMLWGELVCGRVPFSAALADGRVRASGERSDLSAYLPLLR